MATLSLDTKKCIICGKRGTVEVLQENYLDYMAGRKVQEAFPELSDNAREQIINGTHPQCQEILDEYAEYASMETFNN